MDSNMVSIDFDITFKFLATIALMCVGEEGVTKEILEDLIKDELVLGKKIGLNKKFRIVNIDFDVHGLKQCRRLGGELMEYQDDFPYMIRSIVDAWVKRFISIGVDNDD